MDVYLFLLSCRTFLVALALGAGCACSDVALDKLAYKFAAPPELPPRKERRGEMNA